MNRSDEILAMMDAALIDLPTTRQNIEFLIAIEATEQAELDEEVYLGYLSRDEADIALNALRGHIRLE